MLCRIISSFLSLLIALSGIYTTEDKKCEAVFNGTFMQSWLCYDWDDEDWENEIVYMKEAGIEYLILQDIASFSKDGTSTVNYDSGLTCFENSEKTVDFIGEALSHCKGSGIKIFVGLADFEAWWEASALTSEYGEVCEIMAMMEEEIYGKYYEGYEDTFYGWYFTPEINNILMMKLSLLNIIKGFNKVIDKANELNPDMPMLLSPYYTDYLSVPSVLETLPMWQTFMLNAHLRDGDIFCPQDGVGAGWVKLDNIERVWQMYSSAVKVCDSNIQLWANVENLTVARSSVAFMPPATLEKDDTTADLSRFIRQMEIASRYVDNIITFSYNHYFSPNTVTPVYHLTYVDYLKNGKLETVVPEKVKNAVISDGVLCWDETKDNIGIAYYLVYENGTAVAKINSGEPREYKINKDSLYGIAAVDGAGNKSEIAEISIAKLKK